MYHHHMNPVPVNNISSYGTPLKVKGAKEKIAQLFRNKLALKLSPIIYMLKPKYRPRQLLARKCQPRLQTPLDYKLERV